MGEGRIVPSLHLDHVNLHRALFGVCSKLHSLCKYGPRVHARGGETRLCVFPIVGSHPVLCIQRRYRSEHETEHRRHNPCFEVLSMVI